MPKKIATERKLIDLWVGLRILTMCWLVLCSVVRPFLPRESAIAVWPLSGNIFAWIERVVFAPWERWDAVIFAGIVRDGYSTANGSVQFHPLFPLLSWPFYLIFRQPIVALFLVASAASLLAVIWMYRLSRMDLDERQSELACTVFLAFPASALFFAPYTESLWILCAVLFFYAARTERWLLAGAAAAAATLTRQQGLFLLAPLLWEVWERYRGRIGEAFRNWKVLAGAALPVAAYAGWFLVRTFLFSDRAFDFSSVNGFIYSTLLSPSSNKVVQEQQMMMPWKALYLALFVNNPTVANNLLNLGIAAMFLILTALAWRGMRMSYRIFTAIIIAVSFAYYTGPIMPYMGLPRHLLLAFPVFIGAAPVLQGKRAVVACVIFMPLLMFLLLTYVWNVSWVP